jgi:hypothetical protein
MAGGQLTDADRSFQHVLEAFRTAISTPVAVPEKSLSGILSPALGPDERGL